MSEYNNALKELEDLIFDIDEEYGRDDTDCGWETYLADKLLAAGYSKTTLPARDTDDSLIEIAFGVSPGTLTEREKRIIVLRHGLADGIKRTYEDIGKEYSVTRERIRQLEKKALDKLTALKALTDADVAPVAHATWEPLRGIFQCSACGFGMFMDGLFFENGECTHANEQNFRLKYCPNCGAKMDGGNSNDG